MTHCYSISKQKYRRNACNCMSECTSCLITLLDPLVSAIVEVGPCRSDTDCNAPRLHCVTFISHLDCPCNDTAKQTQHLCGNYSVGKYMYIYLKKTTTTTPKTRMASNHKRLNHGVAFSQLDQSQQQCSSNSEYAVLKASLWFPGGKINICTNAKGHCNM